MRDIRIRARIITRIEHFEVGNFGDVKPVGIGVFEARIHYGPGYRLYYVMRDKAIIIMLCGGDKSSQTKDIEKAQKMAMEQ